MRKLFAIVMFLVASTAAQAQYSFEYGGRTIRIDPDRGTVSIPGVYDNTGRNTKAPRGDRDSDRLRKQAPSEQVKADPQPPSAPAQADRAPLPPTPTPPATGNAGAAPADSSVTAVPPPGSATAPTARQDAAPAATTAAPVVATAPVSSSANQQSAGTPAAAAAATTPLGLWLTEEKEGRIRIEPCGANLCGYSVDAKSNQNGEQVLINMKPGKDSRWSGRIFDPNTGSTYESTIALKGPDSLRVQGCAFGGMFCGGQTWTRLN